MTREIKVGTVEDLFAGCFVTAPDDDFPLDSIVPNDDYDADEQDWQRVARVSGYVDLPTLVIEDYRGEPRVVKWQAVSTVWILVEDGKPVVQDEPNGPC